MTCSKKHQKVAQGSEAFQHFLLRVALVVVWNFFMGRAHFHLVFIAATQIIKEYFLHEAETWEYFRNICFLKHLRHS